MAGSPKPEKDRSAATGASEADAVRPVPFERRPDAGPGKGPAPDGPPDAAETAGVKRRDGDAQKTPKSAPGAIDPAKLDSESDDGAG
ncbi:hypothetical protein [Methylopila turkensis]|uniref:Uncharacterized protein n=1 Tax=Methylopila turkensis TaxID=1437816 RepID=A0A9W6N5R0_9HYPH|nr:hypothetical protein [Methylopila turkensis]GLK78492.1 hypothetical protein GCM10008174_02330 [Methylopila turkensis]